jgi:hypothetical protein
MDPGRLDAALHEPTGWRTIEAMQQWLRFLRSLPECADVREIHVIIDCYASPVCDHARALADELGIQIYSIPPGLTDHLQPLDRAVFGALKVEYRAVYMHEMSQREDNSMTRADLAACPLLAWELVSEAATHRGCEYYRPGTGLLERELAAGLTVSLLGASRCAGLSSASRLLSLSMHGGLGDLGWEI